MGENVIGRVHSIQSLGTVDGPGVRYVVFLQGCPLRCGCCHNPDTWDVSGGEPLLQTKFVRKVFSLCREQGIHTCLDTSGCILTDEVKEALSLTDRVLLDIKYTDEESYVKYVGCTLDKPLKLLAFLDEQHIPTTLRQVIIPPLNDTVENVRTLKKIADAHPCVDNIELLPFKKICQVKYDDMGLAFPFAEHPEPTAEKMRELNEILTT